jgi:hypothetical protein
MVLSCSGLSQCRTRAQARSSRLICGWRAPLAGSERRAAWRARLQEYLKGAAGTIVLADRLIPLRQRFRAADHFEDFIGDFLLPQLAALAC